MKTIDALTFFSNLKPNVVKRDKCTHTEKESFPISKEVLEGKRKLEVTLTKSKNE